MPLNRFIRNLSALVLGLFLGGYAVFSRADLTIEIVGSGSDPTPSQSGSCFFVSYDANNNISCGDNGPAGMPSIGSRARSFNVCDTASTGTRCQSYNVDPNFSRTPAGWSGPNSPPTSASAVTQYSSSSVNNGTPYPTIGALCQAHAASSGFTCGTVTSTSYQIMVGSTPYTYTLGSNFVSVQVCPSGYSSGGSGCTLTNASAVPYPSDGHCQWGRSGNSYAADPRDPDCNVPMSTGTGTSVTTGTGGVTAQSANGKSVSVQTDATGKTTVTASQPNSSTGTTQNDTVQTSAPGAAVSGGGTGVVVTGTNQSTTQGTGSQNTGTAPAGQNQQFPTDYNREATQQNIKSDLDGIKGILDPSNAPDPKAGLSQSALGDSGLSTTMDAVQTGILSSPHAATPSNMSWEWTPPIPPHTQCTPLTMTWKGNTATWDWCPWIEKFRSALGYFFYIVTGWALLSILTGGNKQEA